MIRAGSNNKYEKLWVKARDLLASTDKSLLEISTYLGFSSQGYFQNVFRRYTSMTPGDYRKYNRKGLSHQ